MHFFFFFYLSFNFWGTFGVFVKIFRLVFVKLISYNHALHSMLILTMCSWYPKSSSPPKTRFVMVLLLLLFLLTLFGSVMRRHELTSRRTFLTGQFIQNPKSFYLTFQTLLYPVLLALRDGFLFVRKP